MATNTSVRDYCTLLAKSKLLPVEEVEAVYKRWKEETHAQDDQVDPFCKFLVLRRALTEWQAAMLRRGRADGFFLAGYKILDRIGKGQMGGVYKAVHGLGQIVALKILPASKAKNQHILGRFQRETRLLTQLDHPNVVRAYQVGEGGGINYIAMEFLEGETLDETLSRRKQLPWAEAVRLIHQALGGLQHLYERRMIHRDIKPANMMLTPAPGRHD
ncbi:MAG TPA: serine/threonine-protein kinase, partial [Gemmata sp.]|nr:serine/threonine-protein kinase [Gemmata sp.]